MSIGNLLFDNFYDLRCHSCLIEGTTLSSGSLIVNGGMTINGNLELNGEVVYSSTTESTSVSTGALVINGGLGVIKNLNVGGDTHFNNNTYIDNNLHVQGNIECHEIVYESEEHITGTDNSTSVTTGSQIIDGGCGIAKRLCTGGVITAFNDTSSTNIKLFSDSDLARLTFGGYNDGTNWIYDDDNETSSIGFIGVNNYSTIMGHVIDIMGHPSVTETVRVIPFTGMEISIPVLAKNTKDSTDLTTGALVVSGGASITKTLNVGSTTNINGNVNMTSGTLSTDHTTGACVITGGLGVSHNINVNGNLGVNGQSNLYSVVISSTGSTALSVSGGVLISGGTTINSTTQSTLTNAGALVVAGGAGIAKNLNVGGLLNSGDTVTIYNNSDASKYSTITTDTSGASLLNASGGYIYTHATSILQILNVTSATNVHTGALQVGGGAGISGNLHIGNDLYIHNSQSTTHILTEHVDTSGYATISTTGGKITYADTSESSGTSTGSIIISGGEGIAKNLYVGGTIYGNLNGSVTTSSLSLSGTDDSTSTSTGTLKVTGGCGIGKGLHTGDAIIIHNITDGNNKCNMTVNTSGALTLLASGGSIYITSTTATTSTSTGSLVVNGGVGIGRAVTVGSSTESTSISSGAIICGGGVGITKNIYVGGACDITGTLSAAGVTTLTNTTEVSVTTGGALVVSGGVTISKGCKVVGNLSCSANTVVQTIQVYDTSQSTNTASGALIVTGGAAVVKDLRVGGTTQVYNTTQSTNTATGALIVAGGAAVVKDLYVGGTTKVYDTTQSTNTATGALIVAGGAAVVKDLYVGGTIYGTVSGGSSIYTWILSDVKTSGTASGGFTSGANRTRTLNTITGDTSDTSVTLNTSTSQFTITSGKYRISIKAPAYRVRVNVASLYNVTDATYIYGQATDCEAVEGNQTFAFVDTLITIASTKVYEVRHQCNSTYATLGFGNFCGFSGISETYTTVVINKM